MGWVTEHAPHPDDLASCVQCGLCLPSCPTFRLTGLETASPRGRLTAMSAVAAGRPVDDRFAEIMGSCLQCRACEVVCPGFVPFGKAMEGARAELAAQLPGVGRRIRRLVTVRLLRSRVAIRFATALIALAQALRLRKVTPPPLRGALTGMRRLSGRPDSVVATSWPAVGESRGVAALMAGCVMDQWFGDVHAATIGLLTRSGYDVIVPPAQTCCGALAAHDGWADAAREMAATNIAALEDADVVVVNAAGCSAHMKEYDHWAEDGQEPGRQGEGRHRGGRKRHSGRAAPPSGAERADRGCPGSVPPAPRPADNRPAAGHPGGCRSPCRGDRSRRPMLRGSRYLQRSGTRTLLTTRQGQGGADTGQRFDGCLERQPRMRDSTTRPPCEVGSDRPGRPSCGTLLGEPAARGPATNREMTGARSPATTFPVEQAP